MKSPHKLIACSGITVFLFIGALAQSPGEMSHFAQDGVAFEYPAGWSIKDESTPEALQLIVSRKGISVQVMVVAKRGITLLTDLPTANRDITEPLVKKVATMVGRAGRSAERNGSYVQVGAIEAEGVRLHGSTNKRPGTGEVFWLRSRLLFLSLAFVRSTADEAEGSELWQTIRTSLKVNAPVLGVLTQTQSSETEYQQWRSQRKSP